MTSPFSDTLLRDVMAEAPPGADQSVLWDIPVLRCRAGIKDVAREFGADGYGVYLVIEARFNSAHGPIATHAWSIRAETIETAWKLLKQGIYANREGWVDDTVQRKYWTDGHSSMVVAGAT